MSERTGSAARTSSSIGPHPATVSKGNVVQARTRATSTPHPATVSRGGVAQAQTTERTAKPHPATLPRGNAGSKKPGARTPRSPDIDVRRIETSWDAAVAAPPDPSLSVEARAEGRLEFECHGQRGRVGFRAGMNDIAFVTIRVGSQRAIDYWFTMDGSGHVVDAETRHFERKASSQVFSKLPAKYRAPIRLLLETSYAGTKL